MSAKRFHRVPAATNQRSTYAYQIPSDLTPAGAYRPPVIEHSGTAGHELEVRLHLPAGQVVNARVPLTAGPDTVVHWGRITDTLGLQLRLRSENR